MNGMSRVFVGLGLVVMVGFLVVEVLPGINNTSQLQPNNHISGQEGQNIGGTTVEYVITSLYPNKLCDLPEGRHKFEVINIQLPLDIGTGTTYMQPSIAGGRLWQGKTDELPYKKSDYHFGILFDAKPTGSYRRQN